MRENMQWSFINNNPIDWTKLFYKCMQRLGLELSLEASDVKKYSYKGN
jgi:hypothetical protein